MCWNHGDLGWGGWLLMSLGMVAFWGVVVWAVVFLVRSVGGGGRTSERSPREVAADRFARGDIDEVEYRRIVDLLAGGAVRQPGPPAVSAEEVTT